MLQATNADKSALKLNPFLWKSFESLCQRGENPDPTSIFTVNNVLDNLGHCQGINPILQYANAIALPASQQHQQPQHFSSCVTSGSVTSTPLQSQPAKTNVVESTPQQPQLTMSMITPVHNQIESTIGGMESCFTA